MVLVDRLHRAYPIRADIVGLTLSTTLQEHISVELGRRDQALELLARAAGFPEQQDMAQRLIQRAQKLRAG